MKENDIKTSLGFDDVLILPGYSDFLPHEVSLETKLSDKISLSLPFLSAAMDTVTEYQMASAMIQAGAIGVLHRNLTEEKMIEIISKLKQEFGEYKPIAFAIGVSTTLESISKIVESGGNILVLDSAHGHSKNIGEKVKEIRSNFPSLFVIAGNVVTAEGAEYLISCGVHAVKVGMGSGSICTTRLITGIGYGEFSSIQEVSKICKSKGVLTIADGGLNKSDEAVKALAAGADLLMFGYLLAGTDEAPGEITLINDQKYKIYRGMGSKGAMQSGSADRYSKHFLNPLTWVEEGVKSYVKYKGSVSEVLLRLKSEIQTAFGYIGAKNISELQSNARFAKITKAVSKKSKVHTVDSVIED